MPADVKEPLNPLAIAKLLGPNTPTLDHFIRFFSTVRGTDKVLMFISYWSKVVIWFLQRRGVDPKIAMRIQNLAGPASDFRMLLRYYGLLPMIQYMKYLEYNKPPSKLTLHVERIQNLSMLFYYPLEHLYWLGAHQIVPMTENKANKISVWSCRAWAVWVILEFVRLGEQYRVLKHRETGLLKRIKAGDIESDEDPEAEMASMKAERSSIFVNTMMNIGYFPLTLHWSREAGLIPDVVVGMCGGFASLFQLYAAWRDTA
ncbi:hypothetical protein RO3G_04077 [Lichtheimia corymbifera JMRC:FSU:9682]|uniref:Peroxisomal biogenesis factor 11 n=1 Tax=Lichtheimia corymbifera JMRC:FSU:9682 TaxID=1263082 RepID=A0A068S8E4_9FUNG|nr:hypothetical protein RO3G_04077 [Lichtheimia corymbifera JMRC:FSU:9682]